MLVGNRYRELLEAADTIIAMPQVCESFTSIMRTFVIDFHRDNMKSRYNDTNKLMNTEDYELNVLEINASVRILCDSGVAIECCLKDKQFLRAAIIYIVSVEIEKKLYLKAHAIPMLLEEEIKSKVRFIRTQKQNILDASLESLNSLALSHDFLIEVLCTYALLKEIPTSVVLQDFLHIRFKILKDIGNKQSMHMFESFCDAYCNTWLEIARLFDGSKPQNKTSLIEEKLACLARGQWDTFFLVDGKEFNIAAVLKPYIPDIDVMLKHVDLTLSSLSESFKSHDPTSKAKSIEDLIQEWHDESAVIIKRYCEPYVIGIASSKDLKVSRGCIVDRSTHFYQLEGSPWTMVETLVKTKVDIWKDLFREMFSSRIHGLIEESWSGIVNIIQDLLLRQMQDIESGSPSFDYNIESFIWRKALIGYPDHSERLDMETADMKLMLESTRFHLNAVQKNLEDLGGWDSAEVQFKSNLLDQNKHSAKAALEKLSSLFKLEIEKNAIKKPDAQLLSDIDLSKILVISNFSRFFMKELPQIRTAANVGRDNDWDYISTGFADVANAGYHAWLENTERIFSIHIKKYLYNEKIWTLCDTIVQAAEKTVFAGCPWEYYHKDGIKLILPANPSSVLLSAVHRVSVEIGKCGGYSLEKAVVSKLQFGLRNTFVNELKRKSDDQSIKLSRPAMLQLYFDSVYLKLLLCFSSIATDALNVLLRKFQLSFTAEEATVIDIRAQKAFERTRSLFHFVSLSTSVRILSSFSREQMEKATSFEMHNILPVISPPPRISTSSMPADDTKSQNVRSDYKRRQNSAESKYWALINSDETPQLPARKGLTRDNSFRSLASEVASPALSSISSTIQNRLGNLNFFQ